MKQERSATEREWSFGELIGIGHDHLKQEVNIKFKSRQDAADFYAHISEVFGRQWEEAVKKKEHS